ncbi:MAG: divergent polysaccharide deacetylase family protein [Deltaproteobacteria bacterium]|nr:divergent polysaccharide deacetylase family protein [Deltaproteobacteria bacterium]
MDRRRFIRQGTLSLLWGITAMAGPFRSSVFGAALPQPERPPRIALIVDDIGFSRSRARAFLEIGVPITYAVLPRLAHSRDLAFEIHERGQQVMLHQPMEPCNATLDPGPGALFVKDGPDRIVSTLRENLAELPCVAGMNNHMGSRFTASPEKMSQVLPVIRDQGLFFVDSLTSGRSKAYPTACRLHMSAARRNIFLDNRPEEARVLRCLEQLHAHARRHGQAVGIGHPHPETALAVGRFVSSLPAGAVEFVHVSGIL